MRLPAHATAPFVAPQALALQRRYPWERTGAGTTVVTQPRGSGAVRVSTRAQLCGETRRMAAHRAGLNFAAGTRIAILSKKIAHWLMCDVAAWMAGHVPVPLYATLAAGPVRQILEHSEAKLLFIGKLDGWEAMAPRIPAGLPCIATPLAPATRHLPRAKIVEAAAPWAGQPVRAGDELATITTPRARPVIRRE